MFEVKENIRIQLKKLPELPGVYIMRDKYRNIIYVGKSKNLKNRVTSYFRGFNSHPNKTKTMVVNIAEFDYIITDSEKEALLLEANLIKKHKPKFNVMLKDDKEYPFLKLTVKEDYPRLLKVRKIEKDGARYFGPYSSNYHVNIVLETLHELFPIRKCDVNLSSIKRPCLNYHIKRCIAPCAFNVKEEHDALIKNIASFLTGDSKAIIVRMKEEMAKAGEQLDFERAIYFRDRVQAIESLQETQKMTDSGGMDQDIISAYSNEERTCVALFNVRGGKIIDRENHVFDNVSFDEEANVYETFIMQYYKEGTYVPEEIIIHEDMPRITSVAEHLEALRGRKVTLTVPRIGKKKKTSKLVHDNATEYLEKFVEKIEADVKRYEGIRIILESITSSPKDINRIEAYDISNIYGVMSVGSMVVFENGKKKKSDYRKFKIKHVKGPDDYASIREVLGRRLKKGMEKHESFRSLPELILIDGGKGQVSSALSVLEELGLHIPVMGMVKDDRHRTDALLFENEIISLERDSDIYRFIYEVQEEVHRFAIDYHRKLRSKSLTASILDDIDGIGPTRRNSLLKHFMSMEKIRNASIDELMEAEGMTKKAAKSVHDHFRNLETDNLEVEEER